MPLEEIVRIRALSLKHGIKLHLDGARLWHASIATGVSMKDFCQNFDTVSLCLSKGIGAPIGSILVGSEAVIKKARHFRLLFGGGWRQAGFLAEASLWCIKNNWPTMESTHRQAKYLERAFVQIGCTITNPVETNMIWVETTKAGFTIEELMAELAKEGIRISGSGYAARIVLHCQISDEVVAKFIEVLRNLASTPKMKISVDLTRASMSELSLRSSSPSISYYEDEEIFLPPASEPQPPRQQLLSKQSAQSSKRSASVHSRRQIAGSARFYASETALVNSAVAHRHAIYVAGDDGPDHSAKGYLLYEDMHGQSPGPRYQTANVHGPEPVPRQQGRRSNPPTCKQGGDRTRPRSAYEPTPLEYALLKERMEEEKNFRAFYLAQESGRQYGLRRSQSLDGIDAAVSATSGSASTTAVSGERGVGVEGDDDDEDERGRADMFELCTAAGTGGRAKKVGRLQYKLAHHPASVAIKRASHCFAIFPRPLSTQNFALETTDPTQSDFRVQGAENIVPYLNLLESFNVHELDTARVYCEGDTETVLGQVPSSVLKRFEISTKVYPIHPGDHKPEALSKLFHQSLAALKVSKVKIFYLHAPDFFTPFDETLKAVDDLYKQGLFEQFGLSNFAAWQVALVHQICHFKGYIKPTVYQGWYNPLMRQVERELFPCLREFGMRFYAYNPIAGGFLTGNYKIDEPVKPGTRFDNKTVLGEYNRGQYWFPLYFDAVEGLKSAAAKHGIPLLEASIRWLNHHSGLGPEDGLIFGINDRVQDLRENLISLQQGPLPDDVVKAFEDAWDKVKSAYQLYFRRDVRYLKPDPSDAEKDK
ncbi:hypothetical protein BGW38_004530 [Lunasporangiospora selenospora]|uniref:NADP-dependent oxidoreductase domain-containing protein n=1 Tax=Lunasporangiospora selenospora TaxID=979761 RepID=A0A9P6FP62_9FUNG|nr:hypothetical protein BGW38_004530 [Lunasporangiospora selenospora]